MVKMTRRYIEVSGSSKDRGIEIGRKLKDSILTNYYNQKEFYKNRENFDYEEWGKLSEKYIPFMEKYTPEVLEELYGMAEGSAIEFNKILALTTAYEKSFGRNDKCTSFFLTGEASSKGETIIGQTNDENLLEWRHELDLVIHHKPENENEILIYTHPGVPAYMGMNNHGLGVLWTYIDNGVRKDGLPTNAIIRHLLNYTSIEEAIDFLKEIPHDIPNHFGLADKKGNLVCLECFPNKVYVRREENYFVHTNHNIYAVDEPEWTESKTTFDRYATIKKLVENNYGKINIEMAKDFLRNHEKEPNSICVHPSYKIPWSKTMAAMVFDLDRGIMNIALGNPCEVEYREYKFDKYF